MRLFSIVVATIAALVAPAPAAALVFPEPGEPCVPSEAWVEAVDHPAVGAPMIEVPNPEYVPAQPAVYRTEWKYTQHGGPGVIWVDNDVFKYVRADGAGTDSKPKSGTYYERTQNTRAVLVTPARPAVSTPTISVLNPDHVPAWTELVQHEGVACPVPEERDIEPPLDQTADGPEGSPAPAAPAVVVVSTPAFTG